MKADLYAEITDRILAGLEAGVVAWRRPWKVNGGRPISLSTGRGYRGINLLILSLSGFADPRWGTYRAIQAAGGQVRKGEKSEGITFWKRVERKAPKEGEDGAYWLLRGFRVFNASQCDGLPELDSEVERAFTPIETAEAIVRGYAWFEGLGNPGPPILHGYSGAAYSLRQDQVHMPNQGLFESDEAYYQALFHELAHSSGHESRLNRLEPATFGTDPYAREELVAEICASFLAGAAGFSTAGGEQSAAYLASWIEQFRNDTRLIVKAAGEAQRAADLILGTQFETEPEEAQDSRIRESGAVPA